MMSSRDKQTLYSTKQEEGDSSKTSAAASTSSRQWSSGLKNPRIVRVARSFGGKDRHSKVYTIKGLRDRRIRLSVPTAIQLYDLQDRLGLSQPSKVIDWLLDNTKNDIDKLPPLPVIPGSFTPFHQPTHASHGYATSLSSSNPFFDASLFPPRRESININSQCLDTDEDQSLLAKLKYWDSNNAIMRSSKQEDDNLGGIGDNTTSNNQVSAQNLFPLASGNTSMLPPSTLLSSHPMFNYYHWEPSNLSLTQLGSHGLSSQNDHTNQGHNSAPMPPQLALSSRSQMFLSPSMMATSSHSPPHSTFMSSTHHHIENDMRQFNRFHSSNPYSPSLHSFNGLGLRPFPLSMSHHPQLHQNDEDEHQHKTSNGPWKEPSRD